MLKNLAKRSRRLTVGADKAYDVAGLVSVSLELNVHPHVIQGNKKPRSAIDERTTDKSDMASVSENFGWRERRSDG